MTSPFHDRMGQTLSWSAAWKKIANRVASYGEDVLLLWLGLVAFLPSHTLRKLFYGWAGVQIGRQSTIHTGAKFYHPAGVTIGDGTIIGDHAVLDGRAPLRIGNHVDIASQVMIYNSEHDINSADFGPISAPVTIGDYVFIGPRAIILPGVTLGAGAVVAAGAVVTKDVPDHTIVGGVPAKIISERQHDQPYHYRLGRPRLFQ